MTGGDQHRTQSPWLPHHKKSYNIADILNNDKRHCRPREKDATPTEYQEGDPTKSPPGASISPYPANNLIFSPSLIPLLANQITGSSNASTPQATANNTGNEESSRSYLSDTFHHHQYNRVGSHPDFHLRRSSPASHGSGDFPGVLGGQSSSYQQLTGLGQHHPHAATMFPSPSYISLLLANPFVQPYLHHQQRFQDFYGYNGRQFMGSKRKGGQVRFASAQTARLEKEFLDHKYLHANDRKRLAQALKLTDRQVKTWFQNRRAKWRKVGVMKGHRSESHVSASFETTQDEKEGYSPDQGRCISVSSIASDEST